MAIDIFSIPAMSSEVGRVFSGTKHTNIEALECWKSGFREGTLTQEDLSETLDQLQET